MRQLYLNREPVREVIASPDEETLEDHDITEVQEPPQMTFSHKRKPAWEKELIQDGEKYGVPEGTTRQVKRPKPFSSYTALMCNLLDEEPTCFVAAKMKWKLHQMDVKTASLNGIIRKCI
jgi:hypothetical protein